MKEDGGNERRLRDRLQHCVLCISLKFPTWMHDCMYNWTCMCPFAFMIMYVYPHVYVCMHS